VTIAVYTHGRRDRPQVALTFDDGPNPPRTDQILDILAARQVRATFFVLGKRVERFPRTLERLMHAGHVIGNHSYLHAPHTGDFDRAEAAVAELTGRPSRFVRAPYAHADSCAQSPLARSPAVKIVNADVSPRDFALTDPAEIVRRTLDSPALAGGSIVVLHDGAELEDDAGRLARPVPMIEALPAIIDGLRARGLQLVGLDELELVDPRIWSDT
jgi:peptidoglycan/xylan/chitin deacetylase (PgdA/CDA1 family)